MKSLRLGYVAILLLSACGGDKLQVDKDQVFSKQFPANRMALGFDDGRAVNIRALRSSGSGSGAHGFVSQDYFGGCASIFGCDQSPYSYFTGFSNYSRAWNPGISRTVNLNFGARNNFSNPFVSQIQGQQTCVNLSITSNKQLQVLRYGSNDYYNQQLLSVSGSGSNTIAVSGQTYSVGNVVFAVVDQQALTTYCPNQYQQQWGPQQWWNFNWNWQQPTYPSCGAPQQQATLRITGSVGPCSGQHAVNEYSSSGQTPGIDLTAEINVGQGSDPFNWFFTQQQSMPYFRDVEGDLWGRVLSYDGGVGANFWGL